MAWPFAAWMPTSDERKNLAEELTNEKWVCSEEVEGREMVEAAGCEGPVTALCLSAKFPSIQRVPDWLFSAEFGLAESLLTLDLTSNKLRELPPLLGRLQSLTALDISRNWLRALPSQLGDLKSLAKLNALGNQLRTTELCLPELASLPLLRELDLRYNDKIDAATKTVVTAQLGPRVECHVTIKKKFEQKLHAADRDATLVQSQMAPHCTPTLRRRLALVFGEPTDPSTVSREQVIDRLVVHYDKLGPRAIRRVSGMPVSGRVCVALLEEMKLWVSEDLKAGRANDRPTVNAQHYMILRSPADFEVQTSNKAARAAGKLARFSKLWGLARDAMLEVDEEYGGKYTAVAFTKNFNGSPHIDTQNIGPFMGLALGEFQGGGALCVESSAREVAHVDTRHRLGKVDGRFPHWVDPDYTGDRYSVIYYQTLGEGAPPTTAVFAGEAMVEDPPTFNPSGYQYVYDPETGTCNQ